MVVSRHSKYAVSAVRVSSEIRAEWRDLWPTFPVSCGVLVASCPGGLEITTSSGCSGSSPRSALIKICANKKIGKKVKGAEDHPEVRRPSRRKKKMHWKMHWKMQRYPPHT